MMDMHELLPSFFLPLFAGQLVLFALIYAGIRLGEELKKLRHKKFNTCKETDNRTELINLLLSAGE